MYPAKGLNLCTALHVITCFIPLSFNSVNGAGGRYSKVEECVFYTMLSILPFTGVQLHADKSRVSDFEIDALFPFFCYQFLLQLCRSS